MGAAELEKIFCLQIPFTQAEAMLVGAVTLLCELHHSAWIIFVSPSSF